MCAYLPTYYLVQPFIYRGVVVNGRYGGTTVGGGGGMADVGIAVLPKLVMQSRADGWMVFYT